MTDDEKQIVEVAVKALENIKVISAFHSQEGLDAALYRSAHEITLGHVTNAQNALKNLKASNQEKTNGE